MLTSKNARNEPSTQSYGNPGLGPGGVGLVLFALAVGSCSGSSYGAAVGAASVTPDVESKINVEVENRNFSDATVYAQSGGNRVRIGRVTGKTTATLEFEWYQDNVRMLVDFTAGRTIASGYHTVVPGANEDLRLIIGVSQNSPAILMAQHR